ncbi:hypothetical protein AVEN_11845-1 [Araneus ventricosus]|uniref:Uncharacterized protein n=1 Tax=Araneus ventricosus TaxID=182803 RepID=A0A4Y2RCC3_ARAVE|nr:hypothetical protein AVEN_11845-1 [Araneus ventricosus]
MEPSSQLAAEMGPSSFASSLNVRNCVYSEFVHNPSFLIEITETVSLENFEPSFCPLNSAKFVAKLPKQSLPQKRKKCHERVCPCEFPLSQTFPEPAKQHIVESPQKYSKTLKTHAMVRRDRTKREKFSAEHETPQLETALAYFLSDLLVGEACQTS